MYHEGDLQEHCLLLSPEDDISGVPALGEVRFGPFSEGQGDSGYRSFSSVQKELRCRPGVNGGYLAQAHHLHTPLPQGPGAQVPQNLPPGTRGGGSGPGLTLAAHRNMPSLPGLMTDG